MGGSGSPAPRAIRVGVTGCDAFAGAAVPVLILPDLDRSFIGKSVRDAVSADTGLIRDAATAGAGTDGCRLPFATSAGVFGDPFDPVAGETSPLAAIGKPVVGGLDRAGPAGDPSSGGCGGRPAATR